MGTVAQHATSADCWVVVNDNVYDLSDYAQQHPGGARAITSVCGKDGSAAFNRERAHGRSDVTQEMRTLYVGALAH